jgi:ATP-dependent RNA helicase DDX3X
MKYLIIDEADRLLDMGFEKQLNEILTGHDMTDKSKRQNLLFSATFSKEIQSTVRNALSPNYLLCSNNVEDYVVNDNIEQLFVKVEENDKPFQLHQILQQCRGTAISKY